MNNLKYVFIKAWCGFDFQNNEFFMVFWLLYLKPFYRYIYILAPNKTCWTRFSIIHYIRYVKCYTSNFSHLQVRLRNNEYFVTPIINQITILIACKGILTHVYFSKIYSRTCLDKYMFFLYIYILCLNVHSCSSMQK